MDDMRCPSCDRSNPADSSFCSGCGRAIDDHERDAPKVREERRQVTVLFSDVSGYTTMAEEMDPEALRDLMSTVYDRAGAIIESYGGRVDKLMGDAVLAVFGDPVAHEDDAERAVRAALDVHAAVQGLASSFRARTGRTVEMHSGVNSGIIVASDHARDRASGPLGDMVNVAARLQAAASAGEVVVGADTIGLLGGAFALRELGELELKGRRDGVRAALVEGVRSEAAAAPSRRASAFVGRNEELGILLDAVEGLRDGRSSVVSICAEAGAGKSRLLQELRSRLDGDVVWIEGRAYAYTTNIPYSPIVDLLNRVAGIDEGDDAASVSRKLESLIERVSPGDDAAVRAIRQLYGMSADDNIDLEAFRSELAGALSRLVEATARRAPTIVCFQDLHWVDPSTAALVRDLIGMSDAARVTICNFRPGFELGIADARHFELSELSPRQTHEQLVSLLDGGDPPPDLVELVVDRADGNPFFAEEIVNSLVDQRALVRDGRAWTLVEGTGAAAVPSTIRALLEARIDSLDPQRKRVLREASVVGREFLHRVMESIASEPDDLPADLDQLSAADLIRRTGGSDADLEYIFKHALTQEVAYEGLLRRDRMILHGRVARSIEQQFVDRITEMVETLAYHYQRSGMLAEAVKYLRLAGAKALAQYSMTEAHHHYQSAHDLLVDAEEGAANPDQADRDVLVMETVLDWCHAFYYTGEFRRLESLLEQHEALPGRVGDPALAARWRAWEGMVAWTARGAISDALEVLDEAYALATACGDDTSRGYAAAWLTWVCWLNGRCSRSTGMWDEVSSFVHRIPDAYDRRYVTLKSMGGAGTAAACSGRLGEAIGLAKELQAIGDATGNRRATALAHCVMVCVEFVLGNADESTEHADLAVATQADSIYAQLANSWYVGVHLGFGDLERAIARHEEVGHLPAEVGNLLMAAQSEMFAAQIDILQGRLRRGTKRLDSVRARRAELGDSFAVSVADFFLAATPTRIVTKEADGSVAAILANPGFVKRHVVGAAKKGRQRYADLLAFLDANEYTAMQAAAELELGKLAQATKRRDDARGHFARVLEVLDGFPEAGYHRQASERLSELG